MRWLESAHKDKARCWVGFNVPFSHRCVLMRSSLFMFIFVCLCLCLSEEGLKMKADMSREMQRICPCSHDHPFSNTNHSLFPRRLTAAADMLLMPSRFEPCGECITRICCLAVCVCLMFVAVCMLLMPSRFEPVTVHKQHCFLVA